MNWKRLFIFTFISLFVLAGQDVLAQCSMCQAVVESNMHDGERTFGLGLNNAILYLMTVPYIAFGIVGYMMYKKVKAHKQ